MSGRSQLLADGAFTGTLASAGEEAGRAEAAGYGAMWSAETAHDPFLPLALAVGHTRQMQLGTAIAVAFGRSPMTVASTAWDLNSYAGGRLLLGLGTQIQAHVERRYSMPWSHPAARMREFVSALRAIWDCWQNGTALKFEGEFYTHTLMTPFFDPGPTAYGRPRVLLAAVGESMTRVAAETADGMLVHAFTTPDYLSEVTLPRIETGLRRSGRARTDFELVYPAFVAAGESPDDVARSEQATRRQIAFYASTPAYRPVLVVHGWGHIQPQLRELSRAERWEEMGKLIDDRMLDTFAVRADIDDVPSELRRRFEGLVDRIRLYMPGGSDRAAERIMAGLIAGGSASSPSCPFRPDVSRS